MSNYNIVLSSFIKFTENFNMPLYKYTDYTKKESNISELTKWLSNYE